MQQQLSHVINKSFSGHQSEKEFSFTNTSVDESCFIFFTKPNPQSSNIQQQTLETLLHNNKAQVGKKKMFQAKFNIMVLWTVN